MIELTAIELSIISYIVDDFTNAEIAARLRSTESTIKNRINGLYDKLGVSSRVQLVIWYYEENHATESPTKS